MRKASAIAMVALLAGGLISPGNEALARGGGGVGGGGGGFHGGGFGGGFHGGGFSGGFHGGGFGGLRGGAFRRTGLHHFAGRFRGGLSTEDFVGSGAASDSMTASAATTDMRAIRTTTITSIATISGMSRSSWSERGGWRHALDPGSAVRLSSMARRKNRGGPAEHQRHRGSLQDFVHSPLMINAGETWQ